MRILNDLYSVLIAIWISPKNVHCNKYLLVDMGPVDVNRVIVNGMAPHIRSPIRHVTQDPEWRSEISDSGAGELHEPLPSPPEPKMQEKVLKGYKPAYKGKEYNTQLSIIALLCITPNVIISCNIFTFSTLAWNRKRIQTISMGATNNPKDTANYLAIFKNPKNAANYLATSK